MPCWQRQKSVNTRCRSETRGVDAFSLLGDPLRLDIVRVLWEARRGNAVPFSELYDSVDASDTGEFNYTVGHKPSNAGSTEPEQDALEPRVKRNNLSTLVTDSIPPSTARSRRASGVREPY